MVKKRFILGAGGMAREISETVMALGKREDFGGFIVQNEYFDKDSVHGMPVYRETYLDSQETSGITLVCGIGSPIRKHWIEKLEARGFMFESIIHPSVITGETVSAGIGCVLCPGSILTTDITIGKHTIINTGVTLSHDVAVGSFTTISPGVHVAGRVSIGDGVFIGIGVSVRPDVRIGAGALIGAGSVVVQDVAANTLSYGVPARAVRAITENDWISLI